MRKLLVVGVIAAGMLAGIGLPSRAEEGTNPAALAKALKEASVPLEKGLKASERQGKPISGKYELEDGALQLSVYTAKKNEFDEVIVDHKSGAIKKAEKITDGDDLKEAKEQSQAMMKAKVPLATAVAAAGKANPGYRAVSVTPKLVGGRPVAEVELIKGTDTKKVTEKLD